MKKTSGVAANFLCDNSAYFLGIDGKGKPQRSKQCFEAAKELHLRLQYVGDTAVAYWAEDAEPMCQELFSWALYGTPSETITDTDLQDAVRALSRGDPVDVSGIPLHPENNAMTENRKNEMCKEYARCQQNCLSSSAERRMRELEAEAAQIGLRFEMTNRTQYMITDPLHFQFRPCKEGIIAPYLYLNTLAHRLSTSLSDFVFFRDMKRGAAAGLPRRYSSSPPP